MESGKKLRRNAFTLIELLAVIIVISLIAAILIPRIGNRMSKSKANLAKIKMTTISGAVENFNIDCDRYPMALEELLMQPENLEEQWDGPYLNQSDLEDPWGNPYVYVYPSERSDRISRFDLISFGADGEPGGEDEQADVLND